MIKLQRERSENAIPAAFRGKVPAKRLFGSMQAVRGLMAENKEIKLKFESMWSDTKAQLLRETNNKCAYCESPTAVVSFGDVEHYRPKSVYWWLAYVYDNYLASCSVCNQKFKGNKFEFDGIQMSGPAVLGNMTDDDLTTLLAGYEIPNPLDPASVAKFVDLHRRELAKIPNPYFDDPEEFFAWEADDVLKEVALVAAKSNPRAVAVVKSVEEIYGLNRIELKQFRYEIYRPYALAKKIADQQALPDDVRQMSLDYIATTVLPTSSYSGMFRYFEKAAP